MTLVLQVVDGDVAIPLGGSRLTLVGEPESTMQALRDALHVAVGDWFLDLTAGVDREVLVGKLASLIPPEVEIRRVLSRVAGITAVLRVAVRRLRTRAEAQTYGDDVVAAWDVAPGRILYVDAKVTSRTAGTLDLGIALPVAPSP